MRRFLYITMVVFSVVFLNCRDSASAQLQDGDIIFQTSRSNQSIAIQKATHSKYSHMGIIFFRKGRAYVYEAIRTVRYTPLKEWIARGQGGHYVVKRLRNADLILTKEALLKLKQAASKYEGKPYDLTFEWADDRIYCSELVWKIYDRGLGMQVGKLQKLREFDLANPIVKAKIQERYGIDVPLDETVISPEAIYSSETLVELLRR